MTDNLTSITGIGPTIAENLRAAGFETADEVLEADVDELTQADRVGESTAKALLEGETSGYNGRPSNLDDYWEDIMDAAEEGLTYEGIARVAGVGRSTLDDWRANHEEFNAELERHRSTGERELIQDADAEFILERSYDYTKEQEIEHTGDAFDLTLAPEEKEQLDDLLDREPSTSAEDE